MPELYGQPFKWKLRKEIQELRAELWNECKANRETRSSLHYANCKILELEFKIERMEQKARELLGDATEDVAEKTKERFIETWRKRSA